MKKILSILVAVTLVLTASIPAIAAETDSKGLEQAILQVKNVVTIPEDFKEFQYSSSQYKENDKTVSVWYLNWDKEDYAGSISATVVDGGYLINYSYYIDKQNEGLGTVTRAAGQKAAEDFLAKARPDIAADMKLMENDGSYNTDSHYYRYRLYKNDTVVSFVEADIYVDKHSGKVRDFGFQGYNDSYTDLPSTEGVISPEEGIKAYLDKIGVDLNYHAYYDYSKKTLTVFPAYSVTDTGKAIDAKTGEAVTLYGNYGLYPLGGYGAGAKDEAATENGAQLTKEEIEAIENVSGLITKEKAESIIRSTVPGIKSSMKLTSSNLSRSYAEKDKYQWEIGFDEAYATVNAKTGELISFYLYTEDSREGRASLTEAEAKEKAESFLKKVAPEKFEQLRFYENPGYQLYRSYDGDQEVTDYSFNYYRQVNGIDFVDNSFSVTVNKDSGLIVDYSSNWYDSAEFPALDDIMPEAEALDYINKIGKLILMYSKISDSEISGIRGADLADKVEPALVYNFINDAGFLLNPFSGVRIGNDGEPEKDTSIPVYEDIKGHWAEATINKLLDNGYYLPEVEVFSPKAEISQITFLRYLYSPRQANYTDEEFYKMLVRNKIVKEEEKEPLEIITREDAAKFVVRYLDQGKTAEHPEIFVNPFKDRVSDEYKGYAAIAYGLGIMKGDTNGRFNGSKAVTNAEAAVIIYNTLQVK